MNEWIIAAIVVGVLIMASISVIALNSTDKTVQYSKCAGCQGKCTTESNCGSAGCATANGTGKCNCSAKNDGAACSGGCSSSVSCGSATCGAKTTGSCGCKK